MSPSLKTVDPVSPVSPFSSVSLVSHVSRPLSPMCLPRFPKGILWLLELTGTSLKVLCVSFKLIHRKVSELPYRLLLLRGCQ